MDFGSDSSVGGMAFRLGSFLAEYGAQTIFSKFSHEFYVIPISAFSGNGGLCGGFVLAKNPSG